MVLENGFLGLAAHAVFRSIYAEEGCSGIFTTEILPFYHEK